MGKAKYEKPCSSIVLLAEMNGILRQSEGNITDDPATEPAMVQEWCDFEGINIVGGKKVLVK